MSPWPGQVGCPGPVPSLPPDFGVRGWRQPWCCAGTVQLQPKHHCGVAAVLATRARSCTGCCGESYLHPSQTQYNIHLPEDHLLVGLQCSVSLWKTADLPDLPLE